MEIDIALEEPHASAVSVLIDEDDILGLERGSDRRQEQRPRDVLSGVKLVEGKF
jgi:hypothetical protein